jgi:hypothetical protein
MLKMRWSFLALQWVATAASLVNVVFFRLQELLAPQSAELDRLAAAGLAAVAVLSIGAIVVSRYLSGSPALRSGIALAVIALTVLSGFAPRLVWVHRQAVAQAERAAEERQRAATFAAELRAWRGTVEARRPLAAAQAWTLVDFCTRAGRYDDGSDPPSAQALALLREALAAKMIDVNAPIQGPRLSDTAPRPLFLQFYKERIEPLHRGSFIASQDWAVMKLLAAGGADLAQGDAAPLVDDLAKTEVPGAGQFIGLR